MKTSPIFKVSPNAVFEAFDDEVIIINMVSGSYFSLDEVALGIWSLLQENTSLQRIIEATQQQYESAPAAIEDAVTVLVEELEQEGLIIRLEAEATAEQADGTHGSLLDSSADKNGSAPNRPAFQKPVLSKFTDMQDLLLLDPIHEVDETGWPNAKPAPRTGT